MRATATATRSSIPTTTGPSGSRTARASAIQGSSATRAASASASIDASVEPASFADTFRYLFSHRAFLWLVIGACFQAISGYAILFWAAEFFVRIHELSRDQIGLWLGLAVMLGGCSGVSGGGWLADRLGARDPAWYMRLPAIVSVAGLPFAVGFVLLEDPVLALVSFVPFYTVSNMYVGPLWSTAQTVARPEMRAMASAILLFLLNLVGLGLGPLAIGVVNDQLAALQGAQAIRTSLFFVTLVGGLAAPFFWLSSRHLRRDPSARCD